MTPSAPAMGSASTRNGPTFPRARNMTCDEVAWTWSVPTASAAKSTAAVSRRTSWGPRCNAASGEATSDDKHRERPSAVGATGRPEDLPEGWQVRTVFDDDRLHRHPLEARRRRAEADPLALGQCEHPVRSVRVDNARAAVPHLSTLLEDLGDDLNAPHVPPGIEHLTGVDHRVRNGFEVAQTATLRRGDPEDGQKDGTAGTSHVSAQSDRVVGRSQVHGRPAPADVPVAQQAAPPTAQFGRVRLRVVAQIPDVPGHRSSV